MEGVELEVFEKALKEFDYSSVKRCRSKVESVEELQGEFVSYEDLKVVKDRRRVKKVVELTKELNKFYRRFRGKYRVLAITLTFADDDMFLDFHKRGGMKYAMENVRIHVYRKYKRRDFFYIWVPELQKRKVFHYHVLLIVPKEVYLPFLDQWFYKWGFTNIKELKNFNKYYLAKYLLKSRGSLNDKSYQADFDQMREKKRELGVKMRFLGYSLKILHEVLRYRMDKLMYVKWFLNKIAMFPLGSVVKYEKEKGGFTFYGYKLYSIKKLFSFEELMLWLRSNFKHFALLPS